MKFRKIYLEISNLCNLRCNFCPGTVRAPKVMQEAEFAALLPKLRPYTDYLYFHLMGEPLLHPKLEQFLALAGDAGFRVILTTNGTLLPKQQQILLDAPELHKINISLQSFEANDSAFTMEEYLTGCCSFAKAAEGKKLTVFRLWNLGGLETLNHDILKTLEAYFPKPWVVEPRGTRIGCRTYLEYGDKFDWPELTAPEQDGQCFCYGLRDQLGVLCDGTVVPCCLDHNGDLALGNLFETDMEEILSGPRATAIYSGFSDRRAVEPLCRRCGYIRRFTK